MEIVWEKCTLMYEAPNLFSFAGFLLTKLHKGFSFPDSVSYTCTNILVHYTAVAIFKFLKERNRTRDNVRVMFSPYCHMKTSAS